VIYPVPQKNNLNGKTVCISSVNVYGEYKTTAENVLSEYGVSVAGAFPLEIMVNDSRRTTYVEDLSMLSDEKYFITVTDERILIEASCRRGVFRAVHTLAKLIKKNELKTGMLEDYPLFSRRGYIEGFYGGPGVLHPVPQENTKETIRQLLNGNPYLNAYIIQFENKPAGYCLLSHSYSNPAGGLTVWIEQLYVDPEYRGHKLADKALRELFKIYADTAKCYRLEVTEDNKIAKKIYYRLGFKMQGYQQMIKE
jgi:ribosomal protein S18 acetylase RimI-like enzyme